MDNIFENTTIIYKNGIKKRYNAISLTNQGIYIGEIQLKEGKNEFFANHTFIPYDQIEKIKFYDENGNYKDIDFKKFGGE
jgi:hypothetical protein